MATVIIYGPPGSGKTVNATLVPGKTLLLCSDNSSVVLNHFERPDLTIKEIASFKEYITEFEKATQSKQYDTVITDCLTDLIDGYIVECRESGKFNDIRQAYMNVYTKVKYFVRKAAYCGTDCIFTCWEDIEPLTDAEGNIINRRSPMLPNKKASIKSVFSLILRRDFFAWYLSKPYTQNTAKFHIKSIR